MGEKCGIYLGCDIWPYGQSCLAFIMGDNSGGKAVDNYPPGAGIAPEKT